MKTKNPTKI